MEKELEKLRKEGYVLANRAIELNKMQKFDEALTCIDMSIDINSHDAQSWGIKGDILSSMGDMKKALEINPQNMMAFMVRSTIQRENMTE